MPDTQHRWTRFLLAWLFGTGALLVLVAGINVVVDPFFVFGTPLVGGLNRYKPATQGRETLAKPGLLLQARPRTLLVGTSKVQVGLDPASAAWAEADRPVFNLGLPGRTNPTTLRTLRDALALAPVRHVILLIEPSDLMEPPGPPGAGVPLQKTGWARARELVDATLTGDALQASLQTVLSQHTSYPSGLRPNGQMYDGIFRGVADVEGPGILFAQKTPAIVAAAQDIAGRLKADPGAGFAQLDTIRDIIALCRDRGVALDLALAPLHADFLRALDLAGLWPRYLMMRDALVTTVAEAGGGDRVRLWSFLGFDAHSTEPVPPVGRRGPALRWFWEPNHFRAELGQAMIDTIQTGQTGFGTLLTQGNVASGNEAQTEAMERDRRAQPAEWARLADAFARTRQVAGVTDR